jgi:hypothetical protein
MVQVLLLPCMKAQKRAPSEQAARKRVSDPIGFEKHLPAVDPGLDQL